MIGDEPIQYEDDVVYIIDVAQKENITKRDHTNNSSSQNITVNDIQRIKLYGEVEEGKEGDMSSIAVDTHTNTIYAGIRYFQGGREGVFAIDDNNGVSNRIKFIPLGETGPRSDSC